MKKRIVDGIDVETGFDPPAATTRRMHARLEEP